MSAENLVTEDRLIDASESTDPKSKYNQKCHNNYCFAI